MLCLGCQERIANQMASQPFILHKQQPEVNILQLSFAMFLLSTFRQSEDASVLLVWIIPRLFGKAFLSLHLGAELQSLGPPIVLGPADCRYCDMDLLFLEISRGHFRRGTVSLPPPPLAAAACLKQSPGLFHISYISMAQAHSEF